MGSSGIIIHPVISLNRPKEESWQELQPELKYNSRLDVKDTIKSDCSDRLTQINKDLCHLY